MPDQGRALLSQIEGLLEQFLALDYDTPAKADAEAWLGEVRGAMAELDSGEEEEAAPEEGGMLPEEGGLEAEAAPVEEAPVEEEAPPTPEGPPPTEYKDARAAALRSGVLGSKSRGQAKSEEEQPEERRRRKKPARSGKK